MRKEVVMIGLIVVLCLTGCNSANGNPVMITAHRGDQSAAPENTLAAFQAAIDNGADFIELDVTETKDGKLVILHDDSLKRTASLDKNIWEVTYEEICDLDAGSWYAARFAEEKIPTLEETIRLCKDKIKLNIEIKVTGHESAQFEENIVKMIQDEKIQKQCIVTSFNYNTVKEVKQLDSSIQTGAIISGEDWSVSDYQDMDLFSMHEKVLTKELVEEAHSMGMTVHVWTVNDEKDIKHFQKMGVDNIITNEPGKAKKIVQ